ncbi:MAG: methionyl-tRNA formyltransferase [Nonlabens sp.]|jgi:methionyl-tRNA formyltransferase
MHDLRIIYMGTPEFAVPSLQILVENGYNVVAVITAPDRPKGRGQKLTTTPVKDYAVSQNLPVLQPTNLKSQEFLDELKGYKANLQIVVAFRMLPVAVWDMPEIGTFNLHGSLLPQYRGAAPINWAIINGEKETGVTTFFLKHEIDTGNVIFQEREPIEEDDNVGDVYARLMEKGAHLVLRTVKAIEAGGYPQEPQKEEQEIKHAPKIFKETCEINWNKSSEEIYNFIRGLSPYPAAWTMLNGKKFKVFAAQKIDFTKVGEQPGDFETDNKSHLHIQTGGNAIAITELQMEGKKRMDIKSFLIGNSL